MLVDFKGEKVIEIDHCYKDQPSRYKILIPTFKLKQGRLTSADYCCQCSSTFKIDECTSVLFYISFILHRQIFLICRFECTVILQLPISNSVSVGRTVASGLIILMMSICSRSPMVMEATLVRNSTASTWSSDDILFLKQN